MSATTQAPTRETVQREILARQGLRLPATTLKHLRSSGIYCQPTISIERQTAANRWVLRGVESGGAVRDLGAYSSFVDPEGNALSWLQRVDSVAANGVHAVVVGPVLVRIEMIRIERTYDLLLTRHELVGAIPNRRPRLQSSVLFYGRRGSLEMELWDKDAGFEGLVCPVFYSRGGERVDVPRSFQRAVTNVTSAVCCLGCRHCHLLEPRMSDDLVSQKAGL